MRTVCSRLRSVKDITQTYVQNASFEADAVAGLAEVTNAADGRRGWTLANPTGWTVSGTAVTQLLVKADCYADNNFGQVTTVTDGEAAYYLRQGWATGSTKVAQTLKNLPAGKKSYAVNFILQDESKTHTDKAIEAIMNKLTQNLTKQLQAELR